jgi:hypothetical protein
MRLLGTPVNEKTPGSWRLGATGGLLLFHLSRSGRLDDGAVFRPEPGDAAPRPVAEADPNAAGRLRRARPRAGPPTAPVVGGLAGAGTGAFTAPQGYAPEGLHRGGAIGLGAGLGAAGGGTAGWWLGKLLGAVGGGRFRHLTPYLGALAGGTLGAGLGGGAVHSELPIKPWETGQRPFMERLESSLLAPRPAPAFSPGYGGPPYFAKTSADNRGPEAAAEGLRRGAWAGGLAGSAGGAGLAGLISLLRSARAGGHDLAAAGRAGGLGGLGGGLAGTALGALLG